MSNNEYSLKSYIKLNSKWVNDKCKNGKHKIPKSYHQKWKKITNASKNVKKREPLYTVSGNGNWCRVENISPKIKIEPPYDSQIPLLGIYLKNTLLWKDECISHSVMSGSLIVVHQAPLSMKFYRQEYLSGLLFPSPGDLANLRIEPMSPILQVDSLLSEPPRNTCTQMFIAALFTIAIYGSNLSVHQ